MEITRCLRTLTAFILVKAASAMWNDCGYEPCQWPEYSGWNCEQPCGPFDYLPVSYSQPFLPQPFLPQPFCLQQPWPQTFWMNNACENWDIPATSTPSCSSTPIRPETPKPVSPKPDPNKEPCRLCNCVTSSTTCGPPTTAVCKTSTTSLPSQGLNCCSNCGKKVSNLPAGGSNLAKAPSPVLGFLYCCLPWHFPCGTKFIAELIPQPIIRPHPPSLYL